VVLHCRKPAGQVPSLTAGEVDLDYKEIELGQTADLNAENLLTANLIEWKDWDLFRLFFIVARLGSINRAAIQLKLSQPTLSRRLTELERSLGAPLFFRDTSGITLTEEGEALYRSAGYMMQAFENFQKEIRESIVSRSSVVKISASEGMTKHWLLPRLKQLRDQDNELQFEVYPTASHRNLAVEDLDFVIRIGDPGNNELIGKRVGQISFGLYASREYLKSRPVPLSLADLSAHCLIGLTTDIPDNHKVDDNADLIKQFSRAAASGAGIRLSQVAGQVAATSVGFGLALLAIPFAEAEGLIRVLPTQSASLDIWLLRRRESHLRKQTNLVKLFLEREFFSSKAWLDVGEDVPIGTSR
jgi:DNA-binding transcriptional LysR family regulator